MGGGYTIKRMKLTYPLDYRKQRQPLLSKALGEIGGLVYEKPNVFFLTDTNNHIIRRVFMRGDEAVVTTFAGSGRSGQDASFNSNPKCPSFGDSGCIIDGHIGDTQFKWPTDIAVGASGTVYVADLGHRAIRMISPGTPPPRRFLDPYTVLWPWPGYNCWGYVTSCEPDERDYPTKK